MLFNIIKILLTIVEVAVSLLLVTAILIQKSKTQGAGLAFGSGMGETLFGGQIGNVMTKVTVVLAVIFLVNTTVLTFFAVKAKYRRQVPAAAASAVPGQPVQSPAEGGVEAGTGPMLPVMPDSAPALPAVSAELPGEAALPPVEGPAVPVVPAE